MVSVSSGVANGAISRPSDARLTPTSLASTAPRRPQLLAAQTHLLLEKIEVLLRHRRHLRAMRGDRLFAREGREDVRDPSLLEEAREAERIDVQLLGRRSHGLEIGLFQKLIIGH